MNINITWPTQHQWAVIGTHVVVGAGGAIGAAAFLGVLDPGQVQEATNDVKRITSDVSDLIAAVSGLVTIGTLAFATVRAGPIGSFFRAAAAIAADPKKIAATQTASIADKAPVVAITDKLPEVAGVPTASTPGGKALADAVPSATVQVAK